MYDVESANVAMK